MKETKQFAISDKIFHLSNPSVVWVIEEMKNNKALCTSVVKGTLETKKEWFTLSSLEKIADNSQVIFWSNPKRNHHF